MTRSIDGRVPPHDLDAEAAVLSAVLLDRESLEAVLGLLSPEHFYADAHRRIYEAAVAVRETGQPVDVVTVGSFLKSRERLAQVGGMPYLTDVLNAAPAVANVVTYAKTVVDLAMRREIAARCQRAAAELYFEVESTVDFLQDLERDLHAISARTQTGNGFVPIGKIAADVYDAMRKRDASGQHFMGTPTGFDRYDRITAGTHEGDLTVVAARPGMGKTAFVMNVAENIAASTGDVVLVFSLEMQKEQLATRVLCSRGKVDLGRARFAGYSPNEWNRITSAVKEVEGFGILIDDTPQITHQQVRFKVRAAQSAMARIGKKIRLVIVDYLQIMEWPKADRSDLAIGQMTASLKRTAKELRVPVMVISQLNRELERRADKRPTQADLRESGAIEQDADNIVFIYRDDFYNDDSAEPNIAELIIDKQRNGPTGTVKVRFDREYTRFDNLPEGEWVDSR